VRVGLGKYLLYHIFERKILHRGVTGLPQP
jgi:hypothetical protein